MLDVGIDVIAGATTPVYMQMLAMHVFSNFDTNKGVEICRTLLNIRNVHIHFRLTILD
jgi:hypothetical protein